MRNILTAFAFSLVTVIFAVVSCLDGSGSRGRDAGIAFYVLGTDGAWVRHDGSVLPEGELLLEADADAGGMLAGDTVKAVGWNSEKDGSGYGYAGESSGDWWAQYKVTKCVITFDANGGSAVDAQEIGESDGWKADPSAASSVRKNCRFRGWRMGDGGEAVDFAVATFRHSATLYADWDTPLCFEALTAGSTVSLDKYDESLPDIALEYSFDLDADDWIPYSWIGIRGREMAFANVKLYFRAKDGGNEKFSTSTAEYYNFVMSGRIAASGNVMSLLDNTLSLDELDPEDHEYVFYRLFGGCSSLVSAPDLPATALADHCYRSMFGGCSSLVSAPDLPATVLAGYCYCSIFRGCESLVSAPALPAKTLADDCYNSMFFGCESLVSAPALPAKTLADDCYYDMFKGCKSLKSIPELPATVLSDYCYYQMFEECSEIKLSGAPSDDYPTPYRVPSSGTGVAATDCMYDMFTSSGGEFKGTPDINTTYYLHKDNSVVPAT